MCTRRLLDVVLCIFLSCVPDTKFTFNYKGEQVYGNISFEFLNGTKLIVFRFTVWEKRKRDPWKRVLLERRQPSAQL